RGPRVLRGEGRGAHRRLLQEGRGGHGATVPAAEGRGDGGGGTYRAGVMRAWTQCMEHPAWRSQRLVVAGMLVIAVVVMAAAVHRAATASFSHDEALTYVRYVHLSYADLALHKEAYTNNHLLNSVAMKCSASLFGTGELALRLPNLLALALFLFYAARLLLGLPTVLALGGFAVLATNSYMLELFTLARGYGHSFGFMLMALFHLVRAAQTLRTRDIVLFHAASVLATLSNFTLLNAHLGGVITLGMVLWARHSLSAFPR